MRLSDIMSQMGLASYAEVALVLFITAFALIALRVFFASKAEMNHAARLPLAADGEAYRPPEASPLADDPSTRDTLPTGLRYASRRACVMPARGEREAAVPRFPTNKERR